MATNNGAVVQVTTEQKTKQKKISLIACLVGGMIGAHKFYEEKFGMGILYALTCGFMLIGVVIDLFKLLKQPEVYTVEKKHYRIDLDNLKDAIVNFPVEKVGKIVSIIGGGVAGLGCSMSFNLVVILVGLLVVLIGFVITWLKTRDVMGVLVDNGIPAGIAAVAVFAFLLLVGLVIVWILLKVILGIDIFEWAMDLFGDDKKSHTDEIDYSAPAPYAFPEHIYDGQGNMYRLQSSSGDHADYYCPSSGDRKTVWKYDLETD